MDANQAVQLIRNSAFAANADYLVSMLRPTVRIRTMRVGESDLPLGASRFGGVPDVPEDWEWPDGTEVDELAFLAQIHLAEIAALDPNLPLPSTGWLCFFYDIETEPWGHTVEHAGGWRVAYFDCDLESLERSEGPEDERYTFPTCALQFEMTFTLPRHEFLTKGDPSGPFTRERDGQPVEAGKIVLDNFDYEEAFETLIDPPKDGPDHRLLGHAHELQGPMPEGFRDLIRLTATPPTERRNPFTGATMTTPGEPATECDESLKQLLTETDDWRLLLQLDTDKAGPGWMWGDVGRLYFWIPTEKLNNKAFDEVWLQLQCG